jgi:hypothetical protein
MLFTIIVSSSLCNGFSDKLLSKYDPAVVSCQNYNKFRTPAHGVLYEHSGYYVTTV